MKDCSITSACIDVTGITGEIRGRFHQLTDDAGTILRPTLAIVDDPQTRQSARSVPQVQSRLDILTGDIKYLAGPNAPLGIVMPCTVIEPGDAADQLLDRSQHPEWHGARSRFFEEMPDDLSQWEEYGEMLAELQRNEMPIQPATDYYREHQDRMDAGFVVTWPERYYRGQEISAVQHGMNAFLRDRRSFMSEYQNAPELVQDDGAALPPPLFIASKQSGYMRGDVPPDVAKLVAFVDISETLLWWAVVGWTPRCDGYVIDYGSFPDQQRRYYTLGDARNTLQRQAPKGSANEAAILWGLTQLSAQILGEAWCGHAVTRMAVDSAYGTYSNVVYQFAARDKYAARIIGARGHGTKSPSYRKPQPGELRGNDWRIGRTQNAERPVLFVHTNVWKDFLVNRLATPMGDRGCLSLFGDGNEDHRMLCDQLTAETRERASIGEYEYWQYVLPPHKPDNHFFDCLVGCCVLANVEGLSVTSDMSQGLPRRRRKKYGIVSQGV